MKNKPLLFVSIGIIILASGCGGGGSSSSSNTPVASKISINATNADAVAKGGMTPSQTMVKTGSAGANAAKAAIESGASKQSVMQIALAQLNLVKGLNIPVFPANVTGVSLSGFPVTFGCGPYASTSNMAGGTPLVTTYGTMALDIQDMNTDGQYGVTDVVTISYSTCVETGGTITTNGAMSLTINSSSGDGTALTPLNESISMGFTGFSIVDTTVPATPDTLTMSGGMTMALVDDGTTLIASMSGATFSMSSTIDGAFTMKDFAIVNTETAATGAYSFSINMTTSSVELGGDIVITTPTPFSGIGSGNPTSGVMVISGANSSSVTLTAGTSSVTLAVNDGTTAVQPVLTKTVSWDAI